MIVAWGAFRDRIAKWGFPHATRRCCKPPTSFSACGEPVGFLTLAPSMVVAYLIGFVRTTCGRVTMSVSILGICRCPYYETHVTLSMHIAQNNDFLIRRVMSGESMCARSLSSCHLGTMIVFAACARFSEYIDEVRHS